VQKEEQTRIIRGLYAKELYITYSDRVMSFFLHKKLTQSNQCELSKPKTLALRPCKFWLTLFVRSLKLVPAEILLAFLREIRGVDAPCGSAPSSCGRRGVVTLVAETAVAALSLS